MALLLLSVIKFSDWKVLKMNLLIVTYFWMKLVNGDHNSRPVKFYQSLSAMHLENDKKHWHVYNFMIIVIFCN